MSSSPEIWRRRASPMSIAAEMQQKQQDEKILSLDSQRGSVTVCFIIQDLKPIPPPGKTKDDILIFFKLYEPEKKELRGWNIRCMDSGSMHHFVGADSSCISWGQAQYGELGYGPSSRIPLLLVGTNIGDIAVWEVGSRERLALRNFKVWDLSACSVALQASLVNEYTASVNKVMWSPDGALFGVAYSKNIVHLHAYHGGDDTRHHLEINAHDGSVNDITFCHLNKRLCVVPCGDDKLIKVWDAVTGSNHYSFEGHQLPVCSV